MEEKIWIYLQGILCRGEFEMTNKCIVCGKEIPIDYAILFTPYGTSCLQHEGSKELEETLNKLKNKGE